MFRKTDSEDQGHGYFPAGKFLVLAPVALARSLHLTVCFALLISILPSQVLAYTSPGKPTGYMNDFAKVLTVEQEQTLEARLTALHSATGDEVTAVTISSLGDETVESYAEKLFQEWGIGDKDKDNGLLILVATGDHEVRIEVGYGLEGTVTDLQSGNIIRNVMIPAFRNNDYAGGISGGVGAISDILTNAPGAEQYSVPENTRSSKDWNINIEAILFFGFLVLNVMAGILGRTKSWWLGGIIGGVLGVIAGIVWGVGIGVGATIILVLLGLLFDYLVSKGGGGGGRGGFFPVFLGGGRGGSGGSSFGGFGGGMSGGGGASGRW